MCECWLWSDHASVLGDWMTSVSAGRDAIYGLWKARVRCRLLNTLAHDLVYTFGYG